LAKCSRRESSEDFALIPITPTRISSPLHQKIY
jgi:hypothetical protein